ncbi:MAG: hypothetical protein HY735_16430 [Verrucomicrobia bacterium]|nr:hypothetical protein [Verrucomicrobiota bacterium]
MKMFFLKSVRAGCPRSYCGIRTFLLGLLLCWTSIRADAQRYKPGDVVEDFSLINRATGSPLRLSEYAGKIIFLEWFAWW